MTEHERLTQLIRKLLALAGNNPSEVEAARAMERAFTLMAEHNLTMVQVDILGTGDKRVEDRHRSEGEHRTWARTIWGAVAELNFCFHCYMPPSRNITTTDEHTLVGTRANIAATKVMAEYLIATVDRLAREANLQ